MKAVYLATGAANMYCGSCMRDNTLVAAMKAQEHDVVMLPLYTPMRVDEESVSEDYVFYGGIAAYLLQRYPNPSPWRSMLLRLAGSQALLRLLPHLDIGSSVDPAQNADLTLSMLRGEMGNQGSLLTEMVTWLRDSFQPDLIHITNTLISGVAPTIKKALNVPIVCGLHGEDIFIDGLPAPTRTEAIDLIRANAAYVDHFVAISQYYADYFGEIMGLDPAQITLVRPGIALQDYTNGHRAQENGAAATIGYLARISPEKGLHVLVDAFIHLCQSGDFPELRLRAAGYLSRAHKGYVAQIQKQVRQAGLTGHVEILGTVNREQKIDFLQSIDVFSLPTIYRDPKGLPALEAMANGVPVVLPNHGAFPELVTHSNGGLLHQPVNVVDLSQKLGLLLRDGALRKELGRQGHTAVHGHFSAERMAHETLQVYQDLLPRAK